jgi:hypothetical protein
VPSNLFIPSSAEAITVSFPQTNSDASSSSDGAGVVSRTDSLSSNKVLSNGAVAGDPYNGAFCLSPSNGAPCGPSFNGAPSVN